MYDIDREAFKAWLRTKPAEEEYDPSDTKRCIVSQYLGHETDLFKFPEWLDAAAFGYGIASYTFGAALKRIEAWKQQHTDEAPR